MKIVFTITSLLISIAISAQDWQKLGGPLGGYVKDIEYHQNSQKVYLIAGNNQRLYVSDVTVTNNTWSLVTAIPSGDNNNFQDIEITSDGTIYALTSYQLYRSTDNGASFQALGGGFSNGYRIKRLSSGNLVILANNSTYISVNGGQNWSLGYQPPSGVNGNFLAVNSVDQIFIIKDGKPHRSTDGGLTFVQQSTGIGASETTYSLVEENNRSKVYCVTNVGMYSSNNGTSWASIKSGVADATIASSEYSFIDFTVDGLGMYFLDNVNKKIYSKTLGAASWSLISGSFPSDVNQVVVASAAKDYPTSTTSTVFFATNIGVLKTTTGANSIETNNKGITEISSTQMTFDDFGNFYMLPDGAVGLLRSTDKGNSWSRVTAVSSITRYLFTNDGGSTIFVVNNPGDMQRSTDKGSTWPTVTKPVGFIWADAADASKIFGLASNVNPSTFYYSKNLGANWTASPITITGLPSSFYIYDDQITFASANLMLMYLYNYGTSKYEYWKITFTYNGSNDISTAVASQLTNIPLSSIDSYFALKGNFYFYTNNVASGQLAVSSNGGTSWSQFTTPLQGRDILRSSNGYVFLSSNSSSGPIHFSRDNGSTFTTTNFSSETLGYNVINVMVPSDEYAYLGFYSDVMHRSKKKVVLPNAPTLLTEVGLLSNAVALRWVDNGTNEDSYTIERSTNGVNFTKVGDVESFDICSSGLNYGFFVDETAQPSTAYQYRVYAVNEAGNTSHVQLSASTQATCVQNIPDNRSWNAVNAGETGLTIVSPAKTVGIKSLGNGKYEISDLGLGIVPGNSGLLPSTFYQNCGQTVVKGSLDGQELKPNNEGTWNGTTTMTLKWRACDTDETETVTLTLNSTDPAPAAPSLVQALVVSNTSIEISWVGGFFDKTYIVERSLNSSSGFAQIGSAINYPTTKLVDNGPFTDGVTYFYRVKARNGNSSPLESPYSSVVSVVLKKPNFIVSSNTISNFDAVTLGSYWADFNNDGLEDYLTMKGDFSTSSDGDISPVIFRGRSDGNFDKIDVTLNSTKYFIASVADFDNDGYPDLSFTRGDDYFGFDLYKGNGDFTFTQVANSALGDLSAIADSNVQFISWADADNDGLLDIVVGQYDPATNTRSTSFYHQNTNHTFTKLAAGSLATDSGKGNAALWADYNNDGLQDVLFVDSDDGSRLHRNTGGLIFENVTVSSGIASASDMFSASWADYNNDGHLDLFAGEPSLNKLLKNNGNGTFSVETTSSISESNPTLSVVWGDFNNDGFLDLYTPGFISYPPRLFIRDSSSPNTVVFNKITTEKLTEANIVRYGAAASDYDKNGLLDIGASVFKFEDPGDRVISTNNNFYLNNNTANNWLLIKLDATTSNADAYGTRVRVTAGGRTITRQVDSRSSITSKNSSLLHFGLGSATVIDNIEVRWPSGLVQNIPNRTSNQLITVLEEGAAPTVTTLLPLDNASNVAIDTKLEITFNEGIIPVAGKKIDVFIQGSPSPEFSINANSGTITGNKVSFTPPSNLDFLTIYDIVVEVGAFTDQYGNPTAVITWSFVTLDNVAPAITFTPPSSVNKGQATTFNPTVTDNSGQVSAVTLHYRKIAAASYSTASGTSSGSVPNQFDFSIAANFFDETGLEYYFLATDPAGNEGRLPAGTGTFKTYITYSLEDSKIPSGTLGFGGTKNSWKIFTIPFELGTNNSVASVFDELSDLENRKDYRLLKYKDQTKWAEFPVDFSTFSRGEGYFVNIKNPEDIKIAANLTAPTNDRANLYQMNLKQGWNMIGNPYLTAISWANVKAYNSLTGNTGDLVKYTSGQYSKTDQNLTAFEGGFVFADAAVTVSIPFSGQTSSSARHKDIIFEEGDWLLPITINYGEFENSFGGVGMHKLASVSFDQLDGINPPRFFDYAEMNVEHLEHFAKRFSKDIVPNQQEYVWDIEIASNVMDMLELVWDNELLRKQGVDELYLFDIALQRPIDMTTTRSYSFDPAVSTTFKIYYGENLTDKVLPGYATLGKAYPNPTNGLTNFTFTLSEKAGQSQQVRIEVVDPLGKNVDTVVDNIYQPGFHEVSWDASKVEQGMYTYRLLINGKSVGIVNGKLVVRQ
jgi:hypothetical protein